MTDLPATAAAARHSPPSSPAPTTERPSWRSVVASTEIDTRQAGMLVAAAVIWIAFHILSHGRFLTARNLWNLSVQSASIAVMATGMVLIIVSRNIDLSVGSLLGFLGYSMAVLQWKWIPETFGLGLGRPYTWAITLLVGMLLGAIIGALQGFLVAYLTVPAFIVTLGGFLVWRGLIFRLGEKGQTIAPLDKNFQLIGGGAQGALGAWKSWVVAIVACVAIAASIALARNGRRRYDLPVRPKWIDIGLAAFGCGGVIVAVGLVTNRYKSPITGKATGIAYPVVILIAVTLVMNYIARRRRFGRYVYAYGGNPEAAELGGINTRRTVTLTFVLMGILCAISAAIQTARLNAAVTNLGVQNELDVISAAVIGGTSFSGGVGTIHHAVIAIGHGASEDRLTVAGHRGWCRPRHGSCR
jgi:D-xylose transport system permease protein